MKEVKHCEHCGQTMMIYRRSIRLNMLQCLRRLYFNHKKEAVKINTVSPISNTIADFPKLRFWGLIEAGDNGTWRITEAGIGFILGKIQVKKYIYLYNNEPQPTPIDQENPLIWAWQIAPQEISKEIVLADAMQYPYKQESGQLNFL